MPGSAGGSDQWLQTRRGRSQNPTAPLSRQPPPEQGTENAEGTGFGAEVMGRAGGKQPLGALQPAAIMTRWLLLPAEASTAGAEVPPPCRAATFLPNPQVPLAAHSWKLLFFVSLKQSERSAIASPWWGFPRKLRPCLPVGAALVPGSPAAAAPCLAEVTLFGTQGWLLWK